MEKKSSLWSRIIQYVGFTMLIIALTSFFIKIVKPKEPNPPNAVETPTETIYTITYLGSVDELLAFQENELPIMPLDGVKERAVVKIIDGLFKDDGYYPTGYVSGKSVEISDLEKSADINLDYHYTFGGWYVDSACTQEFTGITEETVGDVTIYAKLTLRNSWTAFY